MISWDRGRNRDRRARFPRENHDRGVLDLALSRRAERWSAH